jgi:hypothetical protein
MQSERSGKSDTGGECPWIMKGVQAATQEDSKQTSRNDGSANKHS